MYKLKGLLIFALLILLVATGMAAFMLNIINDILEFIKWLFGIKMTDFGISASGEILIKVLTFIVSFVLVGEIFKLIDIFDSNIMKIVYFVISSILGFAFSYVIYIIQENITLIIVFGIFILIVPVIFYLMFWLLRKKEWKNLGLILYHGTTLENVRKIRKDKYLMSKQEDKPNYLSEEIQTALTYTKYHKEIALVCIKTRWWSCINKKFIKSRKTSDFGSINQFAYSKKLKFNRIGIKSVEYLCLDKDNVEIRKIHDIFTEIPLDSQKLNRYILKLDYWEK